MDALRILSLLRGTLELADHLAEIGVQDIRATHSMSLKQLVGDARLSLHRMEDCPDALDVKRICLRFALRLESRLAQNIIQHLRINDLKANVRLEIKAFRD